MHPSRVLAPVLVVGLLGGRLAAKKAGEREMPDLRFDHIHTHSEVATILEEIVARYPNLTRLHRIGTSHLGKDLLVLEITNQVTGDDLDKPGLFIDGNLHSGEIIGGEICLNTIRALVAGYGKDPFITEMVDNRSVYVMPKLNPDGSDQYITTPHEARSVLAPFDEDEDGLADEDPGEDLNGDRYITLMRLRDSTGPMKTSPEDPRLMVPRDQAVDPAGWKGEWRVYTEGIDNDGDGLFNEDGVGGIDINRNFPEQWQPSPVSFNPGPYPLSEPESRAVADFLLGRPNLTGLVNYHMSGNVAVYPPSNIRTDPLTGDIVRPSYEDELIYKRFGGKAIEVIDNAKVQVFKIHGASPATWHGSIWGVYVDWAYYRLGIYAWIHEVGIYPGVTDIFPSYGKEIERLRWSDENRKGELFVDWTPLEHPQLGRVEIGGFLDKIYDPAHRTYTNVMCLPGPDYERLLANHTLWHLYLLSQSPLVRITRLESQPMGDGIFRIEALVENQGFLPTHVTHQALQDKIAKPVKAAISFHGASLVTGRADVTLGHIPGNSSPTGPTPVNLAWVAKATAEHPTATVRVVSQKAGTHARTISLKE